MVCSASADAEEPTDSVLCRYGRSAISPAAVMSWRQRIMDCVKLPAEIIAPTSPVNVVIVKRPYSAGRGFLNAPEAVATMQVSELLTLRPGPISAHSQHCNKAGRGATCRTSRACVFKRPMAAGSGLPADRQVTDQLCIGQWGIGALCNAWVVLQAHFKGAASFVIEEVEEPTLYQQASIYHAASIVIQMHGAALGAQPT